MSFPEQECESGIEHLELLPATNNDQLEDLAILCPQQECENGIEHPELLPATNDDQLENWAILCPQQECENGIEHLELLPATNDDHGGVIVEMKEAMDSEVFVNLLRASVSEWRRQGKKDVWIKLPIDLVSLVEPTVKVSFLEVLALCYLAAHELVKEGFWYHHAEPNYLMLVFWIPETPCTIPANASSRAVIGAIILNEKRELLVVQEKSGKFKDTGVWKIPTGVVDEGEDVFKAATREVKEETGIDTEFLEVLAFRHAHKTCFGRKSDLLFICMMRPLSLDIQKQEIEIEDAQWMPFEIYAAQPFAKKHDLFKYITDLCLAKLHGDYGGLSPLPITSAFNNSPSYLYLKNSRDLNNF